MKKNRVEKYLVTAIEALDSNHSKIANADDKIVKAYRSQISSFGAAVSMGSFKSAVAYMAADSQNEKSKVKRSKLLQAIDYVVMRESNYEIRDAKTICKEIVNNSNPSEISEMKDKYIDASIAIKLAMNAYTLVKD